MSISKACQGAPARAFPNKTQSPPPDWLQPYWLMIKESQTALSLYRECLQAGWTLHLQYGEERNYSLDSDARMAFIQSPVKDHKFHAALFYEIVKALRDMSHEIAQEKDAALCCDNLCVEDILKYERARTADLETTAILVGWELCAAGLPAFWTWLRQSEIRDMAKICQSEAHQDSLECSMLAKIFKSFYACSKSLAKQDHETLSAIDAQFYQVGTQRLKGSVIEALARDNQGASYLKDYGDRILSGSSYNQFENAANIHHLYQIMQEEGVIWVNHIPFRDADLAQKFMDEAPPL